MDFTSSAQQLTQQLGRFTLVEGTAQQDKIVTTFLAQLFLMVQKPGAHVLRLGVLQNLDAFLSSPYNWQAPQETVLRELKKHRKFSGQPGSTLYLDTWDTKTQTKTPFQKKSMLVWPAEYLKDGKFDQVTAGAEHVLFCTWTDNFPKAWQNRPDVRKFTLHSSDVGQHQYLFRELETHKAEGAYTGQVLRAAPALHS